MSPELYWYVSNALSSLNLPLTHYTNSSHAEKVVYNELPDIVILNGDDGQLNTAQFIGKMRNHVFARNVHCIVFTSDTSFEYKKALIIQGASFVFYKHHATQTDPKDFKRCVEWLLNYKTTDQHPFDTKALKTHFTGELTSWGRIGFINELHLLIESNIELNPGESIAITSPLLNDLAIKDARFVCIEKNNIGRYYQYNHSLLGRIESRHTEQDRKKIKAWIADNTEISRGKPVKIIYFESDANYRDQITTMLKMDKKYCARGFKNIKNFAKILEHQLPHLILINRKLINQNKTEFDAIKKFVKTNFCFCITYDLDNTIDILEYKKNYPQFMHVDRPLDEKILESMILKLSEKMPKTMEDNDKLIFNKHSPYSRIAFHSEILINEVCEDYIGLRIPYLLNPYCSMEISSNLFVKLKLNHLGIFRAIECKKGNKTNEGILHRSIFIGMSPKDNEIIRESLKELEKGELK